MPPATALRPHVELGSVIPGTRYRTLRQIGAGAGAVVYEVEHLELGRRFVLRVLRAELAQQPDVVRRARADWQALGKLRHPHVARVTDAGMTARGVPYCVTEQLSGETLRQRLARRCRVTVPEALRIARELAGALAAAHAIGVTHGNVEPATVVLTRGGCSKLCHFGSYEFEALAVPGGVGSDVYGLGLVVFEMIAGRSAFDASRVRRGSAWRRARGRPLPLSEVVPGVSRAVSEAVARLLAPEPRERPTLTALIAELRCLELRYQNRVSTTQETAHYVTERVPFRVGTASLPSGVGPGIVPLPSQTLEGIPWTVTQACADGAQAGGADVVAEPPGARPASALAPRCAIPLLHLPRASGPSPCPRREQRATKPSALPARVPPPRWLGLRLMLVLSCSLLGGVLAASLTRRSSAGEASVSRTGTAAERSLGPSGRRARPPAACAGRSAR